MLCHSQMIPGQKGDRERERKEHGSERGVGRGRQRLSESPLGDQGKRQIQGRARFILVCRAWGLIRPSKK